MSTSVLKALPGKLDIKRHSPSILYLYQDYLSFGKTSLYQIIAIITSIKYVNDGKWLFNTDSQDHKHPFSLLPSACSHKSPGCTHCQLHFNTRQANCMLCLLSGCIIKANLYWLDEFMLKLTINNCFVLYLYKKACIFNFII